MWLDWRGRPAEVTRNTAIPWALELQGGASKVSADLRRLRISSLDVHGGSNELSLLLGQPAGTIPIRAHGGSHKLRLQYPAGVALRLHVQYTKEVKLNGNRLNNNAGDARWESPDYHSAAARYDIQLLGGATDVGVTTR